MGEHEHEPRDLETEIADAMGDDPPEPEHEHEPEPEPEQDAEAAPDAEELSSFARAEEVGKKLDTVQKYVARKMGDILGDDAQLFEECEVCSFSNTPGWRPKGPYPPEVIEAVLTVLGQRSSSEFLTDQHSRTCRECDGLGQVASGSRVAGWELLTCHNCGGKGWEPTDDKRGGAALTVANGGAALEVAPMPADRIGPAPENLSPEAQAAKDQGYIVIAPAVHA